ncbi:hypothetical protein EST38_g5648 [Candolleomyces aberdarensis]|uniref:PH domain-containing protein n=1 Tax=Candolleomyces aberdarensis TaxID=2316362 RepID=A0A4Q2DLN2_9AGAR|nr:hypothetical protein EST38_g5648 [Candolleomyces aberdarensis]
MLNRAPSRASGRTAGSTLSKSQSLIKKNIELQDLKPADVLIERFVAWKALVKQLTMYFEGLADIENNSAKEMVKLAGLIQVPFKSGNQFLGEGGLQDVYYSVRDKSRAMADQHANLGRTIDSSIVEHLKKLLAEIKAHIRNVQNDTGKLAASVAKERETSTRLVGELANSVSMYKNTPMQIPAKSDPYITNASVSRQLSRQVLEENLLQKSIIIMQQNSATFEEGIVRSLQSAWATFDEWNIRSYSAIHNHLRDLAAHMEEQRTDREWIAFASRTEHLVDPETPMRDPGFIVYPLKDDPSTRPVHTGHLERKTNSFHLFGGSKGDRGSGGYKEGWYVLSPAGFLHEFATSDPGDIKSTVPTFSIFLPNCTLGPASAPNSSVHKFHIEGRRDGSGNPSRGGLKNLLKGHSSEGGTGVAAGGTTGETGKAWTFRARSHEDMMEWWNDIRMLCARYLVASQPVMRSGPVEHAVRSVGYAPEDIYGTGEEEDEGEYYEAEGAREGSSVEEDVEHGEMYVTTTGVEREAPPGYHHHHMQQQKWVEIGGNGWAVDKKLPPPTSISMNMPQPNSFPHPQPDTNGHGYYDDHYEDQSRLPAPVGSGAGYRGPYDSGYAGGYVPSGVGIGSGTERRRSTRGVNGNGKAPETSVQQPTSSSAPQANGSRANMQAEVEETLDRDVEQVEEEEDDEEDTLEEESGHHRVGRREGSGSVEEGQQQQQRVGRRADEREVRDVDVD